MAPNANIPPKKLMPAKQHKRYLSLDLSICVGFEETLNTNAAKTLKARFDLADHQNRR
jgi:hypothetical protein